MADRSVNTAVRSEPLCVACLVLPKDTDRRRLSSPSSQHVLPVLREIVLSVYSPSDLCNFGFGNSKTVVCKACFSKLEGVIKQRKKVEDLKESFKLKIERTGEYLGLHKDSAPANVPVPSTPRSRKRALAEETIASTPKRQKRLSYGTPERQSFEMVNKSPLTPNVSVLVKRKKASRVFQVSKSLKSLGRSVGIGNRSSIASHAIKDKRICDKVVKLLGKKMEKEMKKMCLLSTDSILRKKEPEHFDLQCVNREMEEHAPITKSLLLSCVSGRRKSSATEVKQKGRTNSRMMDVNQVVGVCCSILLRGRNQQMNALQRVVSLILYCGHASKRVYTRLQKLLFCLSHQATIAYTDTLGKDFDAPVQGWRDSIIAKSLAVTSEFCDSRIPTVAEKSPTIVNQHQVDDECSSITSPEISSLSSVPDISGSSFENLSNKGLPTYRIVGDNIDKNIKPRDVRVDSQTVSLHYYHSYALRDRVDLTHFDDSPSLPDVEDIKYNTAFLPNYKDNYIIRKNFKHLIARVLCQNMPFFTKYGKGLQKHICHIYSDEMSKKSEVVPLGIIPKNEVSYEGMVAIMEELHKYVPTTTSVMEIERPDSDENVEVTVDNFHYILMGGDQLSVARSRGSQRIRGNSCRPRERLEGLVPVCEDWHSKGCFITAIWKQFYDTSSGSDGGTLYQLRNLINRRNVVKAPMDNLAACEDFFITVLESHILSAAMTLFKMSKLDDRPCGDFFPAASDCLDASKRVNVLLLAVEALVDKFIDISVPILPEDESTSTSTATSSILASSATPTIEDDAVDADVDFSTATSTTEKDHKFAYACDLLSNGLLLLELIDAVREGDGKRIIRVWRYMFVIFKATNCKNYAIEGFTLLMQKMYLFSPRMAAQLEWSRTVNVHGRGGKNIPADLYMEHLNRECKGILSGMYSNVTEKSVTRVSRALKPLHSTMLAFDLQNKVPFDSGVHHRKSTITDKKKIIKQLRDSKVFIKRPKRFHKSFPKHSQNVMLKLKPVKLKKWMKQKAQDILKYH